jgi:drug/metabolite transporter (DMT)-like permease
MSRRDLIDLLLLGAIWGASFLFMRVAAPEFGPVPLIAVRVAVAAAFLSVVLSRRHGFPEMRGRLVPLGVVGALNSAIPFSLFAFATLSLNAGFASVLNATAPLFGALVAYIWFRESLSTARVFGLALGFVGVLILVSGRLSLGGDLSAILACLLAALCYGIAAHYTKARLIGASPLVIATGSQIGAALVLAAPAMYFWPARTPSVSGWLFALVLGIVCTGLAYVLYFRLIGRAGAAKAIAVTYLIPVFGMGWGWTFLDERLTASMVLGCAVILLGIAMATGVLDPGAARRNTVARPSRA